MPTSAALASRSTTPYCAGLFGTTSIAHWKSSPQKRCSFGASSPSISKCTTGCPMPISLGGRDSRQRRLWADAEFVTLGVGHDVPGVWALAVRLLVGRPTAHELLSETIDVISTGNHIDMHPALDRLCLGYLLEPDSPAGWVALL